LCLYWIRKIRKEMKYLKRFNESNTDDVIENVKDILLPINDMGYNISVTEYRSELAIKVVSPLDKSLLMTDEVKEEFIRMKDYLESEGYDSIKVNFYMQNRRQNEKDINDFIDNVKEPIFITPIVSLLFVAKKKL
jgi:hypothetical protein